MIIYDMAHRPREYELFKFNSSTNFSNLIRVHSTYYYLSTNFSNLIQWRKFLIREFRKKKSAHISKAVVNKNQVKDLKIRSNLADFFEKKIH
jgi:hypothetical protein